MSLVDVLNYFVTHRLPLIFSTELLFREMGYSRPLHEYFTDADKIAKDILSNFSLLEKAVAQFDTRFTLRALRSVSSLRKRLDGRILCQAILLTYTTNRDTAKVLLDATGETPKSVQRFFANTDKKPEFKNKERKEIIPEIDIYVAILIQVYNSLK
jgi:26S proteasome regulatory subunit N3